MSFGLVLFWNWRERCLQYLQTLSHFWSFFKGTLWEQSLASARGVVISIWLKLQIFSLSCELALKVYFKSDAKGKLWIWIFDGCTLLSAGTAWKRRHVRECKILERCGNKIEPLSIPNLTFLLWIFEGGLLPSLPRVLMELLNSKFRCLLGISKGDLLLLLLRENLNLNICLGHLRQHFYFHFQNMNLNAFLRYLRRSLSLSLSKHKFKCLLEIFKKIAFAFTFTFKT